MKRETKEKLRGLLDLLDHTTEEEAQNIRAQILAFIDGYISD